METELAYSYLTKAGIDREKGDLENAEHFAQLALRTFDKLGDLRGQSMVYYLLGNIYRHLEDFTNAEIYLDRSVKLAEQIHDEVVLKDALYIYGQEQRGRLPGTCSTPERPGRKKKRKSSKLWPEKMAEDCLNRSQTLAERFSDERLIARCLVEKALMYFLLQTQTDAGVSGIRWTGRRESRVAWTTSSC